MALALINTHLDAGCPPPPAATATPTGPRAEPHSELPGQYLVRDFISEEEEADILRQLDDDRSHCWQPGCFNGPALRKQWGVLTDLKRRRLSEPDRPIPDFLRPIVQRMRTIQGASLMGSFRPNEANAIDYRRAEGHYLGAHCDDRQLSGAVLVNLCLAGDCVMVYTKDKPGSQLAEQYKVPLPRRALQVQSGTVRYDYKHGIPPEMLLSDRRVSITFRQNIFEGHNV